jgi:hypothetical protein
MAQSPANDADPTGRPDWRFDFVPGGDEPAAERLADVIRCAERHGITVKALAVVLDPGGGNGVPDAIVMRNFLKRVGRDWNVRARWPEPGGGVMSDKGV